MIQIISNRNGKVIENNQIIKSTFFSPKSLDECKVNIIDLRDAEIWKNRSEKPTSINIIKELRNIATMIQNSKKSNIVVILPQNSSYYYHRKPTQKTEEYYKRTELCHVLDLIKKIVFVELLQQPYECEILYENTTTKVKDMDIDAAFYFDVQSNIMTKSNQSEKATTIKHGEYIISSLDISITSDAIVEFLKQINLFEDKQKKPDWFNSIIKLNDMDLNDELKKANEKRNELNKEIKKIEAALALNNEYKSILYTNGEELVKKVYLIIEEILECSLKGFVDIKMEDFMVDKNNVVFVGEIKGVTANVKNINVSQIDNHVQNYRDENPDDDRGVKGLLVINAQRNRAPEDRDEVDKEAIKIAKRNGALIITTPVLLDLFEMFRAGKISSEEIIKAFSEETGLYKIKQ